jgi:hypothetical protein
MWECFRTHAIKPAEGIPAASARAAAVISESTDGQPQVAVCFESAPWMVLWLGGFVLTAMIQKETTMRQVQHLGSACLLLRAEPSVVEHWGSPFGHHVR